MQNSLDLSLMKNKTLDELVNNGIIHSYELVNLDDCGNVGKSKFRNTEQLKIIFPNGDELEIGTFCSGSAEDTMLLISDGKS